MKTLLALLVKDLKRDWKRPWSILLFASLPLIMTALMSMVFGGHSQATNMPAIHVAVLDQDKDMFASILRSLPTQGEAAQQLHLNFVDSLDAGLQSLERHQASAFVVLPRHMTEDLLAGKTNTIELYENPAEQILPQIVRQGVSLLAVGLSGAAEILHEPLTQLREWIVAKELPSDVTLLAAAAKSMQDLRHVRTYLFPPLIKFKTVKASDYQLDSTNLPAAHPPL